MVVPWIILWLFTELVLVSQRSRSVACCRLFAGLVLELRKLFLKIVQRWQGEANGESRGNRSCWIARRCFGRPHGESARLETKGLPYLKFLSLPFPLRPYTVGIVGLALFDNYTRNLFFWANATAMKAFVLLWNDVVYSSLTCRRALQAFFTRCFPAMKSRQDVT